MKVLITGARGMLGRDMVAEFQRRGHHVIPASHAQLDVTDLQVVRREINAVGPELVVNCAACTDLQKAENEPRIAMSINALGPRNLALACEDVGAILLQISTDFVFDGEEQKPYEVWDMPKPINEYGKSKLLGEKYVSSLTHKFFIVRTSWLFGRHGRCFANVLLELAKRGEAVYAAVDQRACPTYTVDLARTCVSLAESSCFGLYHVTNSMATTWYDFATYVLRRCASTAQLHAVRAHELGKIARCPHNSELSPFPLQETLGYRLRSWQEALSEYLGQ